MSSLGLRRRRDRRAMGDINVVPYIDVMLVLLVIFMTTAAFVPTGVINVPRSGAANVNPAAYLEVQLNKQDKLVLRSHNLPGAVNLPVSRAQLGEAVARIRAGNPDLPVVIAADGSVSYDKVIALLKHMQDQGIAKVSLLVKR